MIPVKYFIFILISLNYFLSFLYLQDCRQPFQGGSFFDHEGLPYCETHYHAKRGSLCAGCSKPISGRCITAMFRKFHPEHFVCAFCLKQLNKGTFKEQNDKPYCHICFEKLFGQESKLLLHEINSIIKSINIINRTFLKKNINHRRVYKKLCQKIDLYDSQHLNF